MSSDEPAAGGVVEDVASGVVEDVVTGIKYAGAVVEGAALMLGTLP